MTLPTNHPLRTVLNDEVHARPPEALIAPVRVSYLAMVTNWPKRDSDLDPLRDLARRFDAPAPRLGTSHYSADFGAFRVKWERHTEFYRFKFIQPGSLENPFDPPAVATIPEDWLKTLPGQLLVAAHAAFLPAVAVRTDYDAIATDWFAGNMLVGSYLAGGAATGFTDFRIHGDGFSRWLVYDAGLTPRQGGRTIQRLMEIDTYRMLALLALPVAHELAPFLTECERELGLITSSMATAREEDEPDLLNRLTRLDAAIESRHADNHTRFSAAAAYDDLVQRRIAELREERIEGLQTLQEFTERRLAPAMNTCRAAAERQQSLSERVARATQLLSTRVAITREKQNQKVLESMNRRAKIQLRLQQTVEGLSVAAITYYIVGLVGYAAKGVTAAGLNVNAELAMGLSIPVVALVVAYGIRRVRKMVTSGKDGEPA